MHGEKASMEASIFNNTTHAVRVLLVEDDSTTLSTIIPMLELFHYQVVVAKTTLEAMSILRLNHESFDVVLSDLQISTNNALAFQKQVEDDFHIPVVLMSTNDSTDILLGSWKDGPPFFIEKPPTADDLKKVKQYVFSRKKETQSLNYLKRRLLEDDVEERVEEEDYATFNPKKPKLTWTTALHNKFLEAINAIGLDRAVPKKILEYMNVPGLTRVNIASHLQKYRLYLRRLCEATGSMDHGMPQNWNESPFRSTFFWNQLHTFANNSSLNYASSSNLETQVLARAFVSKTSNNHGENNTNMSPVNPPFTRLEGLSTQPSNNYNPPVNILESSYAIFEPNNFSSNINSHNNPTSYIQNSGNPNNANQGDFTGLFDLANDMNDEFMAFLGEEGNQGDISSFFNDNGLEMGNNVVNSDIQQGALNNDQIVGNPFDENAVTMPTIDDNQVTDFVDQGLNTMSMPTLNNHQIAENIAFVEPTPVTLSNLDNNISAQEVPLGSSDTILSAQTKPAQEVQNSDFSNISPILLQDWASKNLDEFSLDVIDDLVSFLPSFDENNGGNNQLP